MAIYHLHAKMITRGDGQDATASAAYRSGEKIKSDRYGTVHDYTRKSGVIKSEIIAPENAPDWIFDRSKLWNEIERVERRKDSQLAREIEISIPQELNRENQEKLVKTFINDSFVKLGMVADVSYHDKGDGNPHAHIMLSTRTISQEGFGGKAREWNEKELLQSWRESWEKTANDALRVAGHENIKINCRTLEAQGIERIPEKHLGVSASAMERRGIATERGNRNRLVEEYNEVVKEKNILIAEIETLRVKAEAEEKAKVATQPMRVSAEVQFALFNIEAAAPMAAPPEPWTVAEMSEVWPDVQAPMSAEVCGVRVLVEKPSEVPSVPLPVESPMASSTPEPGEGKKPRAAAEVPPQKFDVQEQMVAASRELKDKILKDEAPKPGAAAEVPVPPIGATEIATPERRPSVSDEATAVANVVPIGGKVVSSTAEPGEILEPKAAVKAPLVVPPERKRPSPATANVTPTDGEAKRTLTSEPKPKAAAESAPMTASQERRNGQTTPRPEPELSEREYRIQAIARMVAEEQKELHQKFDASYAKVKELKAAEPKGLLEILRESEDHKKWREEFAQAVEAQNRAWEACGGDLTVPDQGESEVKRRLTPEYALEMSKKRVMDEKREERQKARIKERQQQAALQDTVEIKAGAKVTCHTIEPFSKGRTFPAEIVETSSESIKVHDGGKELTLRRENCYFTDLSVPDQNPKPEVPQVSKEDESIQKEALRMREREKEKQRERSLGYGDVER